MKHVVTSFFFIACALFSSAGESIYQSCFARWDEQTLTVGNALFQRTYRATEKGFVTTSFCEKNPDFEWIDTPKKPHAYSRLSVSCSTQKWSVAGETALKIVARIEQKSPLTIWIYPHLAGTLQARDEARAPQQAKQDVATGIETDLSTPNAADPTESENLILTPQHLRITHYQLMDQTDAHNELVTTREWLLQTNEKRFDMQGCVLSAEQTLDQRGIVFLKLAPLPHARPNPLAADFTVNFRNRSVEAHYTCYPIATLLYQGGARGRTHQLHLFQRQLRTYQPGRDGQFLSNTWGDRSRDARINEDFILKEIEAGAKLGVDIVQIDDGWQKGRSVNSASAKGKGVWNGYWAADPHFWDPDPVRFPNGIQRVVAAAQKQNMAFGLWFGPDSSNDAANWQKDADHLLSFYRDVGIRYFKIDSMKTQNATALRNQRAFFDRMLQGSDCTMVFDLDVTAEIRPGYFGLPDIGPLFVENRYSDFHSYWPHQTLRNLWQLSHVVDPLRLRIELLNNQRNKDKYPNDPLAPAAYRADTLFAITMFANPLGWFEVSNLPASFVQEIKPIIAVWKKERAHLHAGKIAPIGDIPDGIAWTGFESLADNGRYVLLFRERNANATFRIPALEATTATILSGRGQAVIKDAHVTVTIPEPLDYLFVVLK